MNRIIKQASIIGLFILAVTIGVKAQGQQYRADIPFNFEANGRSYAAGKYAVGPVSSISQNGIALRGLGKDGGSAILGVVAHEGTKDWDNPGALTFLKTDGKYRLVRIATATFSMRMKAPKVRTEELARAGSSQSTMVSVNLKK